MSDILRVDNGTIHYVFSFVPQRDRDDILKSMSPFDVRTYFAGWTPDYFLYSGNDELYGYITGQLKAKETVQKKGGLKWPFGRKRK